MLRSTKIKKFRLELIISLIIAVGLTSFLVLSYNNVASPAVANFASPDRASPNPLSALSTAGASDLSNPSPTRVVITNEAISGNVSHGHFIKVADILLQNTTGFGGYVNSSNMLYGEGVWNGVWLIDIPSANATFFLFNLQTVINLNGNTTSVQIQTRDVTPQVHGNISAVPYAPVSVTLQELSTSQTPQLPNTTSNFFSPVLGVLGQAFDIIAYYALIGFPLYFGILGFVLLLKYAIVPLFVKVTGWNKKISASPNPPTSDS